MLGAMLGYIRDGIKLIQTCRHNPTLGLDMDSSEQAELTNVPAQTSPTTVPQVRSRITVVCAEVLASSII